MTRYQIFYAVLFITMIAVSGCGNKKQPNQPEGSAGTSNAKSMTQDATKGDHRAIDIEAVDRTPIGKHFALIVGVNFYNRNDKLDYCVQDVEAMRERLLAAGFMPQNIVMLSDNVRQGRLKPSQENIEVELDEMLGRLDSQGKRFVSPGRLKEGDLIVLAFSGHGAHVDGKSYFCPTAAVADRPEKTMVSIDRIFKRLELSPAQHKVMFVDACRNTLKVGREGSTKAMDKRLEMENFAKSLKQSCRSDTFLFQSCTPGQMSIESHKLKHGLFMHFVLKGMTGQADINHNEKITVLELFTFVRNGMEGWEPDRKDPQIPTLTSPSNEITDFDLFASTLKPIKLELLVKEGHRDGMLVENAKVELTYTSPGGSMERSLATGKTDSDGQLTMDISWYQANPGSGSYFLSTTNGPKTNRTKLEHFPDIKKYTIYAPVRPPEKLIRVTLECEKGCTIRSLPLLSGGTDLLHKNGNDHGNAADPRRLNIGYLPGAIITGVIREEDKGLNLFGFPLYVSDNGKTLRLRSKESCIYMNNELVSIDFSRIEDPEAWLREGAPKHAGNFIGSIMKLLAVDNRKMALRSVVIGTGDQYLPVLQWLQSSGVGIGVMADSKKVGEGDSEKTKIIPFSEASAQALVKVQPKHFFCMASDLSKTNIPFCELKNIENLTALNHVEESEIYPVALTNPTKLRHLSIFNCMFKPTGLTNLQSFNGAYATSNFDADVLTKMPRLQLLTIILECADDLDVAKLTQLPRVQRLIASFPVDTDFSFAKKMPYLQALGVWQTTRAHDFMPLVDSHLKYLAVNGKDESIKAVDFENVKKFKRARHDISVFQFEGVCLGSFWLLPLVAIISVIAWWVRRRRYCGMRHE